MELRGVINFKRQYPKGEYEKNNEKKFGNAQS